MANTQAALIDGQVVSALGRVPLVEKGSSLAEGRYNELWLQGLLQRVPNLLPIGEIEPGFGRLLPVSMEVKCDSGYIDNLFVTTDGGIAIVEVKLWRNPEARLKVIAQALKYVASVGRMTYPKFQDAALAGTFLDGGPKPSSLYSVVAGDPEALSEVAFIDAVSNNLRRGRLLVVVAGDGIHTECESLAELLESHAGAHFTFALVEIELFAIALDRVVAVPRTVAKTVLIERGVVRIDDERIIVEPAPVRPGLRPAPTTMSEELFLEKMTALDPALPVHMRVFLDRIAALGVAPDWKANLNLKWFGSVNLGSIDRYGKLWTDYVSFRGAPKLSIRYEIAHRYIEQLAEIIGGQVKERHSGPYLVSADESTPRIDALLPQHTEAWASAIQGFIDKLRSDEESEP